MSSGDQQPLSQDNGEHCDQLARQSKIGGSSIQFPWGKYRPSVVVGGELHPVGLRSPKKTHAAEISKWIAFYNHLKETGKTDPYKRPWEFLAYPILDRARSGALRPDAPNERTIVVTLQNLAIGLALNQLQPIRFGKTEFDGLCINQMQSRPDAARLDGDPLRFKGVGTVLMMWSIAASLSAGKCGRLYWQPMSGSLEFYRSCFEDVGGHEEYSDYFFIMPNVAERYVMKILSKHQ